MKICPNCHVDCENPLHKCWNCSYSFIEGRLINDESEDKTVYKFCPKCKAEVEEDFDVCWNCNYNFIESELINEEPEDETVFKSCPNCNAEVDINFEMCWNCNYSFEEKKVVAIKDSVTGAQDIDCLRCKIPMKYGGDFKFHEGPNTSPLGGLYEFLQNNDHFDLYVCPNCGKVEFFIPSTSKSLEYKF